MTAPGCTADGLSIDCPIAPGASVTIVVDVVVAPGLWRDPPIGTVRTKATATGPGADARTASAETTFGLDFPPGPPTPGIDLSVSNPFLPTDPIDPSAGTETSTLEIRLANTGAVQADGTVDVVTAPGVGIATVPAQCVTRVRVSADRERCALGRIPAGQRVTLQFGLVVTRAARAEAPLLGSVHAALTPAGQDTVTVVASYRVLITNRPVDESRPSTDGDPAVTLAEPPGDAGIGGTRTAAGGVGYWSGILRTPDADLHRRCVLGARGHGYPGDSPESSIELTQHRGRARLTPRRTLALTQLMRAGTAADPPNPAAPARAAMGGRHEEVYVP